MRLWNVSLAVVLVLVFLNVLFRFLSLPENPLVYVQLHITLPVLLAAIFFASRLGSLPPSSDRRWQFASLAGWALFSLALIPVVTLAFTAWEFDVTDPWVIAIFARGFQLGTDLPLAIRLHGPALLLHLGSFAVIAGLGWRFVRRSPAFAIGLAPLAVWMILQIPGYRDFRPEHLVINPRSDITNPVILQRPAIQKNVIIYYFEGMEEAFGFAPSTKDAFAPVFELGQKAIWMRGLGQYPGTEYSAAGYVATQCGVPLTPRGRQTRIWDTTPDHIRRHGFMPGVECLSDVLASDGYQSTFVNGADLSTFAIKEFLYSHRFQRVVDLALMETSRIKPETNGWGAEDTIAHRWLADELRRLAADERPFLLAFENIGTHGPSGYPDSECVARHGGKADLAASVQCGVDHLMRFLGLVDELGLGESTIILLVSDHLMLHSDMSYELNAVSPTRTNLAMILNSGLAPRQITRPGAMFDVFPTLLEALGYQIAAGRAGLGRSLLQPGPTFVEIHGPATAFAALEYNPRLKRHLWRPPHPPPHGHGHARDDRPTPPSLPPA